EAATGKELFQFAEPDGAASMALSPSGDLIVLSTDWPGGKFVIWNHRKKMRTSIPQRATAPQASAVGLFWSPDGQSLVAEANSEAGSIFIYDTSSWKPLAQWLCPRPFGSPSSFAFGHDGAFLQFVGGTL